MELPTIEGYGDYKSGNYGLNAVLVTVAGISVWYSYKTPIAFRTFETGMVIRENDWNSTTGKHLNWIDPDKSKRVSTEEFERLFAVAIN